MAAWQAVLNFFDGLLPEGQVRAHLADLHKVASTDIGALLAAVEADCAGAVQVLPDGVDPASPGELLPITEEQVVAAVESLPAWTSPRTSPSSHPWVVFSPKSCCPGILGFVGALVLVMMALLNVLPGFRWWLLGGGMLLAMLFVWRELRFSPPFLDLRLLGRNRPLLLVYLGFAVFNGIYYFAFFGLPQLLQEAAGCDPGVVGLLMLPLTAISVISTPFAVRAIDRFGVRRLLIAGAVTLSVASGTMWLLTASFAIPLVLGLTALMGVPYSVVSIASSQGMYVSTQPQERGVAAGIFQTCRYLGAITATVLIGIFYGSGVNQANWGLMVLAMLGLGAVAFVVTLMWRERAM